MHKVIFFALLLVLTALLSACPGSTPPGLSVSGKVLDYSGQPGAFLPVMVGGKVVYTDASGNFSASGVSSPYQLMVLQPSRKYAQIYEGVTRLDPIVLVAQSSTSSLKKTTLTVNFSGSGSGNASLLDLTNPVTINGGAGGVVKLGSSYSSNFQWNGPSSFGGNICAIIYQSTNNVATAISSFGQRDQIFFQDGQTTTVNLILAPIASKTISGSVSVPAGFTVNAKTVGYLCGSTSRPSYPFSFDTSNTPSFSYATPVTSNTLYMEASAKKGEAYLDTTQFGVEADATGLSLVLPEPIEQQQPANNALGITPTTAFAWSPTALGVSVVSFQPSSPDSFNFVVYTPNPNLSLSDLSLLGYTFPKAAVYTWRVAADSRLPTINEALSGVPTDYVKSSAVASSDRWQFTTAP